MLKENCNCKPIDPTQELNQKPTGRPENFM